MTMTPPAVGYRSILTATNVTASASNAGYPASALANPLTYDSFRAPLGTVDVYIDLAAAETIDYFGIAGHNLYACGDVTVSLYGNSVSGMSGTPTLIASHEVGSTGIPIMVRVDSEVTYSHYTMRVTQGSPSVATATYIEMAVLNIGRSMQFERCVRGQYTPPQYRRSTRKTVTVSEGGQFLGTTIERKGVNGSFSFDLATAGWCRGQFQDFVLHARTKPYFFAWNLGNYPDEVAYVYTEDDVTWQYTGEGFRASGSFEMNGIGYAETAAEVMPS